jgi:transposase
MEVIIERCAGLDVHKRSVTACVRTPGEGERCSQVRTFRTFTRDLLRLAQWLADENVTVVVMEATGVFWKPPWRVLERRFELILANPRHVKNVPGRKTDVKDAEWLAQLVEHGLVAASFVPPPPIRQLRDLTRYRKRLIQAHTQEWQRIGKVLEDAGIKLDSVASKLQTLSGRDMLNALAAGERDPAVLAELARGRMRVKLDDLRLALDGDFGDHHARLLGVMLRRADDLEVAISELDRQVQPLIEPFEHHLDRLVTIPGVARRTAEVIIAETGGDMSRFPTPYHLASWAGMCPGNNQSAGRRYSGRTTGGSDWLRDALRQAATAAARSRDTYLASRYWQLARRRGKGRAAVAVGHTILLITWHILTEGVDYQDLGGDYFARREDTAARTRRLVRALEQLGHQVTLTPTTLTPTT